MIIDDESMVHSEVKRLYRILGKTHSDSPSVPEEIFIGQFYDGSYHILGCRPVGLEYILPATRQSNDDWGKIRLPDGRKRLEDMQEGDIFETTNETSWIKTNSLFMGKLICLNRPRMPC